MPIAADAAATTAVSATTLCGDGWTVRLAGEHPKGQGVAGDASDVPAELRDRDVPATTPGCVHTDLLAAGLIDDPYLADNELALRWTGRCDWTYRRTFDAPADAIDRQHVDLCFDGLDTYATVTLNGVELGRTGNMHRRYRFDVGQVLRDAGNVLEVAFAAPLPLAWAKEAEVGKMPREGAGSNPSQPHNMMRKMACNTGWDWARSCRRAASGATCGWRRGTPAGSTTSGRSCGRRRPRRHGSTSRRRSSATARCGRG